MTQSVERNVRKLVGRLLVCIVAINGILKGGVGCGVAHHGAVRLGKEPVVALPVGTQRFLCFGLLDHQIVDDFKKFELDHPVISFKREGIKTRAVL